MVILDEDNLAELHRWYRVDSLLARAGVGKDPATAETSNCGNREWRDVSRF